MSVDVFELMANKLLPKTVMTTDVFLQMMGEAFGTHHLSPASVWQTSIRDLDFPVAAISPSTKRVSVEEIKNWAAEHMTKRCGTMNDYWWLFEDEDDALHFFVRWFEE